MYHQDIVYRTCASLSGLRTNGTDLFVEVMDICSTDPYDPCNCATPADIKIDGAKGQTLYPVPSLGSADPDFQAAIYRRGTHLHLVRVHLDAPVLP